ncbi:MAG TPA: hypothetical protein VK348_09095, partial [Planctomycetota bacterium]|nr:hypothetical protein [Planctomycetota bacterium]
MAVLFLLLPVQCLVLPLNTAIIDWFSTLCFPLCWVWLAHVRWAPRFPYLLAMLGILLASAVASVASRDPMVSIPVLAKEVYLYVFLLTIAGVLERL